jgi:hypothetical protein
MLRDLFMGFKWKGAKKPKYVTKSKLDCKPLLFSIATFIIAALCLPPSAFSHFIASPKRKRSEEKTVL